MSDFQTILSVISESGGDRDAFIAAYRARLAKGNAQPAPIEPTPTRKGDTFTRALAGIIVEAERATEAEAKKRTIAPARPVTVQASANGPKTTGRSVEVRELRESAGGNLGRIVSRRE